MVVATGVFALGFVTVPRRGTVDFGLGVEMDSANINEGPVRGDAPMSIEVAVFGGLPRLFLTCVSFPLPNGVAGTFGEPLGLSRRRFSLVIDTTGFDARGVV